jgi:hypothetical protein
VKPRKSILVAVGVALVGAIALGSAVVFHAGPWARADSATPALPRDLGPVVATVNGDPIYLQQIRSRIEGITSLHGSPDALGKEWRDQILQSVVDEKIVEQQASDLGLGVTEQEIEDELKKLRGFFQTEVEFQQWLSDQKIDEAGLTDRIRLQTLAKHVFDAVAGDIQVTRDEAKTWYEAHPKKYIGVDGKTSPFFAVQDEVESTLLNRGRNQAFSTWLEDERNQAQVVVVMQAWWKEIA